jgi:hypothetical protein
MKTDCVVLRPDGVARFASIGIAFLGISITGISLATAENKDAATAKNKQSTYAALAEAPQKAREKRNPFAGDPEAVVAGGNF